MLLTYDRNGSGALDGEELGRVPCDIWKELETGILTLGGVPLRVRYGLSAGFIYRGYALGIPGDVRQAFEQAFSRCVPNATEPAESALIKRLQAISERPASERWDREVSSILRSAYDSDGSGEVDRPEELSELSCEALHLLDQAVLSETDVSLTALYGLGSGLEWVGDALGFSSVIRDALLDILMMCLGPERLH